MGCVKISSICFNVVLAFLGITTIAVTACNPALIDHKESAILTYVVCSLMIVFSFLGCFAAIRESICMTATCAIFLLVMSILSIAAIFTYLNERGGLRNGVDTVEAAWGHITMSVIEAENECCGKISAQDYILLNQEIPESCYLLHDRGNPKDLFTDGCVAKLQDYYDYEAVVYAIILWLFVAFHLLGCLLAVILVINYRNTQRRMQF